MASLGSCVSVPVFGFRDSAALRTDWRRSSQKILALRCGTMRFTPRQGPAFDSGSLAQCSFTWLRQPYVRLARQRYPLAGCHLRMILRTRTARRQLRSNLRIGCARRDACRSSAPFQLVSLPLRCLSLRHSSGGALRTARRLPELSSRRMPCVLLISLASAASLRVTACQRLLCTVGPLSRDMKRNSMGSAQT